MRVRYASRIVTRVFTLLVMTATLTTNAPVSATLSGGFQESAGTLNDQPSRPRLLALRDRLKAGDRTALDKFWNEISEQGAPIIESATDNDGEVLITMLWRAREETKNVFVFRLGDVSKPMVAAARHLLVVQNISASEGCALHLSIRGEPASTPTSSSSMVSV